MVRKNTLNHVITKSKVILCLLMLSIILSDYGTACAAKKKRTPSNVLRSMARIYMACGQYAKAQPLAEKAVMLSEKSQAPESERAMCLIDLAYLYKNQNKLTKAEDVCKQGLTLQKKALYDKHPYVAHSLRTLSSIYQSQGKLNQARDTLDKAVTIMLTSHYEDDYMLSPFYMDIGKLLIAQGNPSEAQTYYLKALTLITNTFGHNHPYAAKLSVTLAQLHIAQGKLLEAEPLINQALSAQEKIYGPQHYSMIPTMMAKAKICRAKGELAKSEELLERAITAVKKTNNLTKIVRLYQEAAKIRAGRSSTYGPIAKATGNESQLSIMLK